MISTLAIPEAHNLMFGYSPHTVACGFDLTIGDGPVYPEVNFALPAVSTEIFAYDCRLMNRAVDEGQAGMPQRLMVNSDEWLNPQAAILSPQSTISIARSIVAESTTYERTLTGCRLILSAREKQWLDRIEWELADMPSEEALKQEMTQVYRGVLDPASYELTA